MIRNQTHMPFPKSIEETLERELNHWRTEENTAGKVFTDLEELKKALNLQKISVNRVRNYDIYAAHCAFLGHVYVGYRCSKCESNIVGPPEIMVRSFDGSSKVCEILHRCINCSHDLYKKTIKF